MKIHKSYLLLFFISLCSTVSAIQNRRHTLNATNGSRTDTIYQRCPAQRQPFFNSQYNDSLSVGRVQTAASLQLNGDALIYDILSKNNTGAQQQAMQTIGKSILYVIFMVIGLIFMLIAGPILICCCCKPDKCPPCLKCRKPQGYIYTNCQRKWPAIGLIILSIVVIGTMIAGKQYLNIVLIINPRLQKGYSQTRCSAAMLFDDTLNGNYTKDGKQYFIGLKPLQSRLTSVRSQLKGLLSHAQNIKHDGEYLSTLLDKLSHLKQQVSQITNGGYNNKQFELNYISPINSAPQTTSPQITQIPSTLNTLLNQNNQEQSLIKQAHNSLQIAHDGLADLLGLSSITANIIPKLSQTIDSAFNKYASLVTLVQQINQQTDIQFTSIQNKVISPFSIVLYIIAGLAILFAIILLISTIMISWKNRIPSKIFYSSCAILSIIGILFFILSLAMSAATAGTHYGCHYIQKGIQNKTQFAYRFKPVLKNNDLLAEMMAECASKEGSGIIINQSLIQRAMQAAHQNAFHLSSYDRNILMDNLHQSRQSLINTIHAYHYAQILDINSESDIKIIQKLSNQNSYSCSAPGFTSDSWVPSVNQIQNYVSCKIQNGDLVTKDTCLSQQDFYQKAQGCSGCIDSFSVLSKFDNYNSVLDALNKRYPNLDCQDFNKNLANVWNNFYKKKEQVIGPAQERAKVVSQKITNITHQFDNYYNNNFKHHVSHLQTGINTITDPTAPTTPTTNTQQPGKINCKVLGQDLQLITNTFCTQIFNYSFSMRILSIIAGFSLLAIMLLSIIFARRSQKIYIANEDGKQLNDQLVDENHQISS